MNVPAESAKTDGYHNKLRRGRIFVGMRAVELDGPDRFRNMNPEFEPRFKAAQRGEHAPGNLCECNERGGVKGTFVLKAVWIDYSFYTWKTRYTTKRVWVPFDDLDLTCKRMSCYGAQQGMGGDWHHALSQLQIATHIKAKRAEKLRRLAWRHIPNAIWFVFRLMEDAAKRAEERRLALIHKALELQKGTEMDGIERIKTVLEL